MSQQIAREIKAGLALAGVTQSAVARELGISANAIWATIHSKTKTPRNRKAIASAIGRDPWRTPTRRKAL